MYNIKKILLLTFLMSSLIGCQKDYNDTSFLTSVGTPTKVSALTTITQDNSGLVTLTPNGENVSYFEIYFGDATTAPSKVFAGSSVQHIYTEGVFTIKVIAHSIGGTTNTSTQQLTVAFRSPENLLVSTPTDASNNFKINLSATASYETYFKVYFGDSANEAPQSFLEGDTISHVYPKIGAYTIKVIAFSGSSDSILVTKVVSIVDPLNLPITFESSTLNYMFTDFNGGATTVINNPQTNGINTSARVAKMIKNADQTWGGSWIGLSSPIDFSQNKIFRMKVFSPRIGAKVLLKVENASNSNLSYEVTATTTVANAWEDLVFDYSAVSATTSYSHIVIIFDNGTMGDGSANFTFLLDDIRLTNSLPATTVTLPLDFESTSLNYKFTDFNGGGVTIISNPQALGINTSMRVAKMVKSADKVYGGSYISLTNPIDFSSKKTFSMKVYSPRVGAKVLLKVENLTNANLGYEKESVTTKANTWETLSFDYSAVPTTNAYQKVVLIFDNGTMGDGSANFTFYFDDITLN